MNFFSLAAGFTTMLSGESSETTPTEPTPSGLSDLAKEIFNYAAQILVPVMIIVAAAGIFYSIYLGVNLAKADSADARTEAKSRMINAIIGFVAIFVLVLLMWLFCKNAETIFSGFTV